MFNSAGFKKMKWLIFTLLIVFVDTTMFGMGTGLYLIYFGISS